jgi:dihydrofolate reductase
LPWPPLKEDFKHFRKVTMGHDLICGHRTFMSMPYLDGRRTFILPREEKYMHPTRGKIDTLEALLGNILAKSDTVMVIGGAKTYARAMPYATHMWLTLVGRSCQDADAFFPEFDWEDWRCLEYRVEGVCTFYHLERKDDVPKTVDLATSARTFP